MAYQLGKLTKGALGFVWNRHVDDLLLDSNGSVTSDLIKQSAVNHRSEVRINHNSNINDSDGNLDRPVMKAEQANRTKHPTLVNIQMSNLSRVTRAITKNRLAI